MRKSRQNAGIDLNLKCRDALPAPLPARIAELGFFSIRGIFYERRGTRGEGHDSRFLRVRRLGLCEGIKIANGGSFAEQETKTGTRDGTALQPFPTGKGEM